MPIIGQSFGQLILSFPKGYIKGLFYWECKCSCGKTKLIAEKSLIRGLSESCGECNYRHTHPLAYKSWDSMKQRCNNPNAPDYKWYGGRGIKICKPWIQSFANFLKDMGDPPVNTLTGERHTLDRIDNNGDYTKENCRWASSSRQHINRSDALHPSFQHYANGTRRKCKIKS